MKILIIALLFAVLGFACSYKHTQVPPLAGEVKAHWVKKGEPAPFDGIVLTKEAYGKLRMKIILLEEQLHQCQESK